MTCNERMENDQKWPTCRLTSPVFKQGIKFNEVTLSKIHYEGTQTILVTFDSKKRSGCKFSLLVSNSRW